MKNHIFSTCEKQVADLSKEFPEFFTGDQLGINEAWLGDLPLDMADERIAAYHAAGATSARRSSTSHIGEILLSGKPTEINLYKVFIKIEDLPKILPKKWWQFWK